MSKCTDDTVAIEAKQNHPNCGRCNFTRKQNHCKNKNNVQNISNNLNILFTVLTDKERSHNHAPKCRVTV